MKLEGIRYKRVILALLALVVVLLALILLINFLPTAPGTNNWQMESRSLEAVTSTETFTFTMEGRSSGIALTIDIGLSAGSLTWTLFDPSGAELVQGAAAAGETISEALELQPVSGAWQVVVDTEEATGEYLIQWQPAP